MLVIKQFGPVTYAMGTLQEILSGTGIAAKVRALPNDVAGCTLEMGADGKWDGASVGTMSKATADALYASGALANLATGATYRDTSGTQYTYSAGAGWVEAGKSIRADFAYMPAFIGDSVTNGVGAPYNLGWVETVILSLGVNRISDVAYRFGVGGNRSDEINARMPSVLSQGFRNLFYMAGANDASQLVPLATYSANIARAISTAKSYGARIFICTPTPESSAKSSASRKLLAQYYAWLMANVEALGGIVIDTTTPILDKATGNILASCDTDGVHPNTQGHNNIAAAVVSKALAYFDFKAYSGVSVSQTNAIQDPAVQSAGPLSTGWAAGANSGLTLTPSVVTGSDGRKWQQILATAGTSGFANYACGTPLDLVIGNKYAVAFDIEIEDVGGGLISAINLNTTYVSFTLQSYGSILAAISDRRIPASDSVGILKGRVQFTFTASDSAHVSDVNITTTIQLASALSIKVRMTAISVMNLTDLGLA